MTSKIHASASQMSPSKFTIHDETAASDVTPKATAVSHFLIQTRCCSKTSQGPKRAAPVNPWYGPPPPMALLTSKISNLNNQRPGDGKETEDSTKKVRDPFSLFFLIAVADLHIEAHS